MLLPHVLVHWIQASDINYVYIGASETSKTQPTTPNQTMPCDTMQPASQHQYNDNDVVISPKIQ